MIFDMAGILDYFGKIIERLKEVFPSFF